MRKKEASTETAVALPHDLQAMTDPKNLIAFLKYTKDMPLEAIDDHVVHQSYAAVQFQFRRCALAGDYTSTRALEIWLNWAKEVLSTPKQETQDVSPGSVAFLPREVKSES